MVVANRKTAGGEVGSLGWFLEGLRQDLEVIARSLSQAQSQPQPQSSPPPDQPRSPPSDIAADVVTRFERSQQELVDTIRATTTADWDRTILTSASSCSSAPK